MPHVSYKDPILFSQSYESPQGTEIAFYNRYLGFGKITRSELPLELGEIVMTEFTDCGKSFETAVYSDDPRYEAKVGQLPDITDQATVASAIILTLIENEGLFRHYQSLRAV